MIYEFEHSSKHHQYWYDNLRKEGDILRLYKPFSWLRVLSSVGEEWSAILLDGNEIDEWLRTRDIIFPFMNKEDEILFRLTFE